MDISKDMNWEYTLFNEDLSKPNTAYLDYEGDKTIIKGHLPLKGINIVIHPESEALSFLFDKNGNLRDLLTMAYGTKDEIENSFTYIKTQYAPVEIHIIVITLLKYVMKKYIQNLEVRDEGKYWESGDVNLLKDKCNFLNLKMKEVELALSHIEKEPDDTVFTTIEKLEKILKEKRFNKG